MAELDLNESECEQERTEAAADTNGSADDVPVAPKPRVSCRCLDDLLAKNCNVKRETLC